MRLTAFLDNDQLASKGLAQLLEAEKSCDAHAKALAVVKGEVNRRQVLSCGASHAEYLKAAQLLQSDHQKSTQRLQDRKSTRLNSSHANISYAVFCLKKKK